MIKNILLLICCLSFSSCSFDYRYKIEGNNVYFEKPNIKDFQYNKDRTKIENADFQTFKILKEGYYAKDNKNVFYQTNVIREADPNTFEVLADLLGKDKNSGFFEEKRLPNSDGKTFQKITNLYSKDKKHIYYTEKIIIDADVNSFEIVDQESFVSRDKNAYYRYEDKLSIKDPKTFTNLKGNFWKDKYHVYDMSKIYHLDDMIITNVDTKTAVALDRHTIKDKAGCHNGYKRVLCDE